MADFALERMLAILLKCTLFVINSCKAKSYFKSIGNTKFFPDIVIRSTARSASL